MVAAAESDDRMLAQAALMGLVAVEPAAPSMDGWSAVRYINDQFDRKYRWQRTLVKAILPRLRPADGFLLQAQQRSSS